MPKNPEDQNKTPASQLSAWIAAAITAGIAILTAVGLSGDSLARVVRVYPWIVGLAGIILLLAMVLGVTGAIRDEPVVSVLGVISLMIGFGSLVVAHAVANSAQERPTATIGIESSDAGMTAQVTVSAGNLKSSQYVFVVVQGFNATTHLKPLVAGFEDPQGEDIEEGEYSKQRLYKGRIGPTPDGTVTASIPIALSPGLYDQVVVQARILDSSESSSPADEDEIELQQDEAGQTVSFPCRADSADIGCGTALAPLPK